MLVVRNIHKKYEGKPLLCGVDFELKKGETICLLGRSGSGKSTLLRIIAGIENADQGGILWNDQDLSNVPIHKRNFGLMFQDYALFPHMSVYENVAFGLKMAGLDANEIKRRVDRELKKVGMLSFAHRSVTELSGGEQQRVALARALAPQPRLLMLDEPLGALDKSLKGHLLHDIHTLLYETEIPAIYVTHDQEEAFSIADRLMLLHHGEIVQQGSPQEVFQAPKNEWVANFLGFTNIVSGRLMDKNPVMVSTKLGDLIVENSIDIQLKLNQQVDILIRPDAILPTTAAINNFRGVVEDVFFLGQDYRIRVRVKDYLLEFDIESSKRIGDTITASLNPKAISILPAQSLTHDENLIEQVQ